MPQSINPATGELLRNYPAHTPEQVQAIARATHAAQTAWAQADFPARAQHFLRLAQILRTNKEEYARLIAQEMGKVLPEAQAEIEKCASTAEYFAANGPHFLADEPVKTEFSKSYVTFQPLGVVLAVMPWNFPFWQALRAAIPALMAGNALVLKHASNTPGCALAIEALFRDAGFPPRLLSAVLIPATETQSLIQSPYVAAVTLTGSTPAGREVAAAAGSALKKTVLELGGSDAYLILEDADIAHAAKMCAAGRLLNCGQSCIAVKRIVAVEAIRADFEQALLAEFARHHAGNPMDAASTIGPLARADLRDTLHRQVQESLMRGAKLLTGGVLPPGRGAFYPPTILTDVRPGQPAYEEELFGPVAAILPAHSEEDAIRIANDSPFGLGGGVFTRDAARGEAIARNRLASGSAFVNAYVRSDARMPFGGVKDSGWGRELSAFGIREFVNIKAVAVA